MNLYQFTGSQKNKGDHQVVYENVISSRYDHEVDDINNVYVNVNNTTGSATLGIPKPSDVDVNLYETSTGGSDNHIYTSLQT